jgi:hypothetical protein
MIAFEKECNWCGEQETSMIEVLKQAIDYIENVPDDRDSVGHIDRKALVLSLNQAIKELEKKKPVAEDDYCFGDERYYAND